MKTKMEKKKNPVFAVSGAQSLRGFHKALSEAVAFCGGTGRMVTVVCIGSDRLIGDCYGPLTGLLLARRRIPGLTVFGTLEKPVHALTIEQTLERVDSRGSLVIAVDSCVGDEGSVGCLSVTNAPLRPGSGLGKQLPPVGQLSVTGVAAADGSPFLNLQNAQLGMIYRMAEVTAAAIEAVCSPHCSELRAYREIAAQSRAADFLT